MLNKDVKSGIVDLAQMVVMYRNELIKNGMTESDAIKFAVSYQAEFLKIAMIQGAEREKEMLKNFSNSNSKS